jgi:hypothetical protein
MTKSRFRNTVLGIGATAAAIAFGYFGVQQLGRNNMFTIAAAVGGCRGHQLCTSEAESARSPNRADKSSKEREKVMSDQDTQKTQPSLTTTEIMTIILGCEQTLKFVQASPNYKQIEASERFSTSNDLRLGDAVQALMEIHEAILNIEFYSQVEGQTYAFNDSQKA